ncbi:MAG: ABC-type branched-chain amino acid transport system, ATPase component [Frankiales bacterium]|nr:ABC-type branched-chain amino acid transport system, ATPase component [Frankiales bacterium]
MTATLPDAPVVDLGVGMAERRAAARATLGMSPDKNEAPALRPVLKQHGLSLYPMIALGVLAVVDSFQAEAFTILAPDMSRALGLSLGALAAARTIAFVAIILSPLPVAALAQRPGRRALICITTGVAWSVVTLFTGMVTSLLLLMLVLALDGVSSGSVLALHGPLLSDAYPPSARVRILSGYTSIKTLATVVSPLMVALLAGPLGLTWRGVFIGLGAVSMLATLASLGIRDPGFGRYDVDVLRAQERASLGEPATTADLHEADVELKFFEVVRRVTLIPSVQRLAFGFLALGVLIVPFLTYLSDFLELKWHLDASGRGYFFSASALVSIVGLLAFGSFAEKRFSADPGWIVRFTGNALIVCVALIACAALAPAFWLVFLCAAGAQSALAILGPGMAAAFLGVVDARQRPHAAAVLGMFGAAGSIVGVLFLSGLDARFGVDVALACLMLPGVVSGLIVRSCHTLVPADMDRMIDAILEEEDIRVIKHRGGHLPMLSCRGVDFSYGQLQVLFDVDFTVDDGEMVALLGTNGAGKSTLLKVISGIGLPSAGSVRYRGQDITYLDAERRVPLGITQVPGGRAVFGNCDVVENLRAFGHTVGRDRKRIEASIEECFEAFPRLHERRASLAANLSGGEQQMLGLSKALILKPQLLLIDELSLGLAPIVVGQLLDMVRRINATGTAVVLVEQSVNIALSLVDHAYFMEKGQMRFDGSAADLLDRGDLLRAVFLEGADTATGGQS